MAANHEVHFTQAKTHQHNYASTQQVRCETVYSTFWREWLASYGTQNILSLLWIQGKNTITRSYYLKPNFVLNCYTEIIVIFEYKETSKKKVFHVKKEDNTALCIKMCTLQLADSPENFREMHIPNRSSFI